MSLLKPLVLLAATLLPLCGRADQNDPRLEELFEKLRGTDNATQALPLEAAIWEIWTEHPDTSASNQMMIGVQQINSGNLAGAVQTYTRLIEQYPEYAEAWNKRATAYYLMQDFAASDADISRVLALEPFHFGALSGRGLVKIGQRKFLEARNAFNAALEVNPGMDSVRDNLRALDEYLKNSAI